MLAALWLGRLQPLGAAFEARALAPTFRVKL